jgi:hypothetical protein
VVLDLEPIVATASFSLNPQASRAHHRGLAILNASRDQRYILPIRQNRRGAGVNSPMAADFVVRLTDKHSVRLIGPSGVRHGRRIGTPD